LESGLPPPVIGHSVGTRTGEAGRPARRLKVWQALLGGAPVPSLRWQLLSHGSPSLQLASTVAHSLLLEPPHAAPSERRPVARATPRRHSRPGPARSSSSLLTHLAPTPHEPLQGIPPSRALPVPSPAEAVPLRGESGMPSDRPPRIRCTSGRAALCSIATRQAHHAAALSSPRASHGQRHHSAGAVPAATIRGGRAPPRAPRRPS
jgi:hypothetical protein